MRNIFLFLTLVVITLSVLPCCALEDNKTDLLVTERDSNDLTEDCEVGCSPFYRCGSCLSVNFLREKEHLTNIPQVPLKPISFYTEFNLSSYSPSIWQPPKLVFN